jgi:hypothetical protein
VRPGATRRLADRQATPGRREGDDGRVVGRTAHELVGRERLLSAVADLVDRTIAGERTAALVAGEAGIGKSSLLRAAAARATAGGARAVWGTCLDVDGAPAYWPWTHALEALLRGDPAVDVGHLGDAAALVATIIPSVGRAAHDEVSERDRLLAIDAVRRLLEARAAERPVLVVLDDLQWADASTLALLEVVVRSPSPVGLGVIGAYREDELAPSTRQRLSAVAGGAELLHVQGLGPDAVGELVERVTGRPVEPHVAAAVHQRTGGHPFFVRQLALLGGLDDEAADRVPTAVRDVLERRIERLPEATTAVLEATALLGSTLLPDVVAAALGLTAAEVDEAAGPAVDAGILTTPGATGERRFAHDLLRETLRNRVDATRRIGLHRAIGAALEVRRQRGGEVPPSELARHFIAAMPADGPDRAVRWATAAAAADRASLAFEESAGHLRRLRSALVANAAEVDHRVLVDVLVTEADALARTGATVDARGLLRHAADVADRADDPAAVARVALATARLGARFAARRDEIIRQLDGARTRIAGGDRELEARLTAALARELQHSVAEDRPRAAELSERALELGRAAGDPSTLVDCLLARHDVLWQPGGGPARAEVARELVDVAIAAGDDDRRAEGLLLLANALLEQGSPAFEGPLESCLAVLDARGEPRHRYTAVTRRACLALLRGRLGEAEALIEDAKALGDRILEPDAGNVHMSQRLELVRARGEPDELAAFASAAVAHWTGAPIHAHAVAAGFSARAGDLAAAERHIATVLDLGTWRGDRSYLWSVFVRELAVAAVAIGDRALCRDLLEDLRPLAGSCGVNGAVVAFAGSHAAAAALVAAATGEHDAAARLAEQAAAAHRRLGAAGWDDVPAAHAPSRAPAAARTAASMRRDGAVWHLAFGGREATVVHTKGLADVAQLVAAPGREVHVLELVGAPLRAPAAGEVADRRAIAQYRRRLEDLEADIDDAERDGDEERRFRAEVERQALLDELGRVTGTGGRPRDFANHPAERARKAVSARIRDAIGRLEPALPDMADHLRRSVVTGTYCRYRPDDVDWQVEARG